MPTHVLNRLTALETRVATQDGVISTLESKITALDSRVAALESDASRPTTTPTPTQTPTPTPTPAILPETAGTRKFADPDVPYLKWEVGPDVPGEQFHYFRTGILDMHLYASSLGLPPLPGYATFYLYYDPELAARTLCPGGATNIGVRPAEVRR